MHVVLDRQVTRDDETPAQPDQVNALNAVAMQGSGQAQVSAPVPRATPPAHPPGPGCTGPSGAARRLARA